MKIIIYRGKNNVTYVNTSRDVTNSTCNFYLALSHVHYFRPFIRSFIHNVFKREAILIYPFDYKVLIQTLDITDKKLSSGELRHIEFIIKIKDKNRVSQGVV